jgi:hypothetical protein
MLALSAVTQFPTNGSSTRWGGEGVQAITSAEQIMTAERRNTRIASPELGPTRIFLARRARGYSRRAPCSRASAEPGCRARIRAVFASPKCSPNHEAADMLRPVYHKVENYR